MGERLAYEIGATYFETSAKDGSGIHTAVEKITEFAVQTFGRQKQGIQNLIVNDNSEVEKPKKRSCCNF